jgi:hypothetical protein
MSFSIYSSVVSLSDLTLNFSQVSRHFGQGNLESERIIPDADSTARKITVSFVCFSLSSFPWRTACLTTPTSCSEPSLSTECRLSQGPKLEQTTSGSRKEDEVVVPGIRCTYLDIMFNGEVKLVSDFIFGTCAFKLLWIKFVFVNWHRQNKTLTFWDGASH